MTNIFLGGGGDEKQSFLLDQLFVQRLRQRKLLYLPFAQPLGEDEYAGCLDWFVGAMSLHGVPSSSITMWADLSNRTLDDYLAFGGIYIGGGITGRLNKILSQSVFPEVLKRALAGEIVLYGGSAGAIVLGQTLHCVPEEIEDDYPLTVGLGAIPRYSFRCHYQPNDFEVTSKIRDVVADGSQAVIALPETSGLTFDGQILRVVGDAVTCWSGGKVETYAHEDVIPIE